MDFPSQLTSQLSGQVDPFPQDQCRQPAHVCSRLQGSGSCWAWSSRCTRLYIYIYTYTYVCISIYVYIYVHTCTCIYSLDLKEVLPLTRFRGAWEAAVTLANDSSRKKPRQGAAFSQRLASLRCNGSGLRLNSAA